MQSTACVPSRQAISGSTRCVVGAIVVSFAVLNASAHAQVGIKGWGWQAFDSAWNSRPVPGLWSGLGDNTVALRADGALDAWGSNHFGACAIPALPSGVVYVEACATWEAVAALRSDGWIAVAANGYSSGAKNVPPLPAGLKYVEVDAGAYHLIARRSDGSVVAWGNNSWGSAMSRRFPRD